MLNMTETNKYVTDPRLVIEPVANAVIINIYAECMERIHYLNSMAGVSNEYKVSTTLEITAELIARVNAVLETLK